MTNLKYFNICQHTIVLISNYGFSYYYLIYYHLLKTNYFLLFPFISIFIFSIVFFQFYAFFWRISNDEICIILDSLLVWINSLNKTYSYFICFHYKSNVYFILKNFHIKSIHLRSTVILIFFINYDLIDSINCL